MNSGPSKAVLVFAAVALLVAGAFSGSALAEDRAQIDSLFQQATSLWQQGRYQQAADALKQLLAADPSQATAYDLLRKVENRMLLDMLTRGGDAEQVARLLMERAQLGEMERTRDELTIKGLVDQAVHGSDMAVRQRAVAKLVANHGEYAVPYLYHYLGSNSTDERVYAILALSELSTDAVLPLIEVLGSENWLIQKNAALVLQKIGDVRAVGALSALAAAKGANPAVKDAAAGAAAAVAKDGVDTGNPVAAYLWLARKYYRRDASVIKNYLSGYTLWSWKDGKLTDREVPKYLYGLELAEECAYDALGCDAQSQDARNMLAAMQYAEWGTLNALGDEAKGSEEVQALLTRYWNVIPLTESQGLGTQFGALSLGLEWNDPFIARQALAAIAAAWDGREITADLPLVKALDAEDKTIRFAAATALLDMDVATEFPGSDRVAPIAAQAVAAGSIRQVLLVEPNAAVRAKALKALDDAGLYAVSEASGIAGFSRAKEVGTFDVIVLRYALSDDLALKIVQELRKDFRTMGIPVLISGGEAELSEARELFGPSVQGFISAEPINVEEVKSAAEQSLNDDQKAALAASKAACDALAGFTPYHSAFKSYGMAEAALAEVLSSNKPDDIRLAALAALANMGTAKSMDALIDTLGKTANATSVRVGAAKALGGVFKGKAAPAKAYDALSAAMGDEAGEVRGAAGAALGNMQLTPAQADSILKKYRVE